MRANGSRNGRSRRSSVLHLLLGLLIAANAIALYFLIRPPGGSEEKLTEEATSLTAQLQQRRIFLKKLQTTSAGVEKGNTQAADFEKTYFLAPRRAYPEVLSELLTLGQKAGLREKENAYATEPIEGTRDLNLLNVTAHYQGTYPDLLKFVNSIDHSPKLLILDTLNASPEQGSNNLNISMRFQAILQEQETEQ